MENKVNNKKNILQKSLIIFIVVMVIILSITIPLSILNIKEQKNKNDKLEGPKKVKEYECTQKGNVCSFKEMYEGVEVNIEVAEGTTYTFSMIANDRNTMTLMLQQNIEKDVEWDSEGSNQKGPVTSLKEVNKNLENWTNISNIEKYNYLDKGKKDSEALCNTGEIKDEYKCPVDQYDTRGYTGLNIVDGEVTFLFNLPPLEEPQPGFEVLTQGILNGTAKARLITLEEYEEFVTDDGPAKWLIDGLDKNEGYWTMTSSPTLTTGYNQAAVAIINRDSKPDTEDVPVARGNQYFKVGVRPVIKIDKK